MKVKFDTHKTFIKNQQQRLVSKSEIRKRKDRPAAAATTVAASVARLTARSQTRSLPAENDTLRR
jgi:hypothetical protein